MNRSDFWAGLIIIGIVGAIITGVFFLIFWAVFGTFFLLSGILKAGGVSGSTATIISLIIVVVLIVFCCCCGGNN